MDIQLWLWFDTVCMLAGGSAILLIGKQRTAAEQSHTIYHGIVCIIAACSYFAMAVGQGGITLPLGAGPDTGRLFYFARYLDWTFTTPLLLLSLCVTAMQSGMRRGGMVTGLLLADLMMILTSLFFGASEVVWIKWTWFLVSCVAFLGVYYVMWGPMLAENRRESEAAQSDYRRDAVILSVLWMVYPVILALSTDGLSWISPAAGVAGIAIIDLISKVVYGLLSVLSTAKHVSGETGTRAAPHGAGVSTSRGS